MTYDQNGNITALQRNGKTGGSTGSPTFGPMDNLTYTYTGNRLQSVSDAVSGDNTVDFVQRGTAIYTYYPDGSLLSDANKEITAVLYDNFLKLPKEIQLSGGRWIKMYYDGSGKLLKREFSTGEYWDYYAGAIYKNGTPYSLNTAEGRVINTAGAWQYEFFYNDYLGNTRVSFAENGSNLVVKDISHFDPTGILLNGIGQVNTVENRFQFQNKESMALFGLSNINDFGARYLDKTIGGRWWGIDPLAEKFHSHSPYNYTFNNPIRFIDPDGAAAQDITLLGANNSSVTVKTDLVDLEINASGLGVDFGGNYTLSGNDVLQAAVDIGGVFDPTPTLDILGASMSAKSGDYWGAAASGLGAALPYVGDLAKSGKIAKGIDKISDAIDAAKGADNAKGGIYALKDGETVVRTGRTTDLARREAEHANDATLGEYKFETKHRTDNYAEQRGLEHKVSKQYESTASKSNGGHNKINAIGDKNPNKAKYIQAADNYLKRQ